MLLQGVLAGEWWAMWVKICGTTSLEDAQLAVDAGADAIGFVFGPSRRQVTADAVAAITRALPERVEKVGVFVGETAAQIDAVVRTAGLTGVQLQGDEPTEFADALRPLGLRLLIRTVWASADVETLAARVEAGLPGADAILLDSGSAAIRGGTGTRFDWTEAAAQLSQVGGGVRVIVAGGLNPSNVSTAVAALRPWGVDVASGVEREPGRKDPEKVRAFVAAARLTPP